MESICFFVSEGACNQCGAATEAPRTNGTPKRSSI